MARSLPDGARRFKSDACHPVARRAQHRAPKDWTQPGPDVLLPNDYVERSQHQEEKAQDVLDEEEEEAVGDVDLGDDQVQGVREEADESEAGNQHRGRLVRGWRERGTAKTKRGGEEEEEGAYAGGQDEGDTERDVVEEVVETGLDRADCQLLLPGGSDRNHPFPQPSVNVVQHLDAKNLRKKTWKPLFVNMRIMVVGGDFSFT